MRPGMLFSEPLLADAPYNLPLASSRALLGAARGEIARKLDLIKDGDWAFTWVVDADFVRGLCKVEVDLGHVLGRGAALSAEGVMTKA